GADVCCNYQVESPTVQTSGDVTVTATDAAGNVSPATTVPYVDATLPEAPTASAADPDGDNMPTVSGTAEPGSTVTVTWPDGTTSTVVADDSGNYEVQSPTVQTSGDVTVTATDAAGNVSPATTVPYVDATLPEAPTASAADPDGDNMPTVSGTAEP